MHRRWYNVAVVALWLTTMSWLVGSKVLPAVLVGEPPSYWTILDAQRRSPSVAWAMAWNNQRIGWALNTTIVPPGALAEMHSRVHFDYLPLADLIPPPLRSWVGSLDEVGAQLATDVVSELVFDPLGRPSRFESALHVQTLPDVIKVRGVIDGAKLSLTVHSGDFSYQRELTVTPKAMLHDAMSPQTHLPGLREGQTWTEELYSPLHPPTEPLEILQVKVEGTEPMLWNGKPVDAWRVVYRNDPGAGGRNAGAVRGTMWVHPDGTVLRQHVTVFQSSLTFTRLPDDQTAALLEKVANEPSLTRDPVHGENKLP
jgi:hypothetical protein